MTLLFQVDLMPCCDCGYRGLTEDCDMAFLETFVQQMMSNDVSAVFTWLIAIFFIVALIGSRLKSGRILANLSGMAPNILTTLGILGTFTGIFIGLLDFDVQQINKSVPALLKGLKIAFGTSILGLASALIFRVIRPIISSNASEEENVENNAIDSLRRIAVSVETNEETTKQGFNELNWAIKGDEDSSLTGQLQRLRAVMGDLESTTKDGFKDQISAFNEFSEQMSKAFSEAIIEELKSVIREFNEKISEQFGDNFKQLNEAVGKLLEWQENYRSQMDELKANLEKALDGITKTESSIENIANATSSIPEHIEMMSNNNEALNENLTKMYEGLSSISEMRTRAENAFPEISERISDLTTDVSTAVEKLRDEQEKQLSTISSALQESLTSQQDTQKQMLDATQQAFNESISNATQKLNDSIIQLDDAMQQELENVLRAMAENLSGIAEKFVQDYKPLLEQSRKVAELATRAKSEG